MHIQDRNPGHGSSAETHSGAFAGHTLWQPNASARREQEYPGADHEPADAGNLRGPCHVDQDLRNDRESGEGHQQVAQPISAPTPQAVVDDDGSVQHQETEQRAEI